MILSRDEKGEQNVSNIILISVRSTCRLETFLKNWFVFFLYLNLGSLSYLNLYEHFRTKLQDLIKFNQR